MVRLALMVAEAPRWIDKVTAIGTAFAALGFIAAALLAWVAAGQLRDARADRHILVLSDFGRRWDEPHLWEAREKQFTIPDDELAALVGRWFTSRDRVAKDVPLLLRVPNFFEDLSIMVTAGQLDIEYVALGMQSLTLGMWDYWAPAVATMREHAPTSYTEFERLVERLRAHEREARARA